MEILNRLPTITVHFFKPSGKWYTAEEVSWVGDKQKYLPLEFAKTLKNHLSNPRTKEIRLNDMVAVCLDFPHDNSYPQMFAVKDAVEYCGREEKTQNQEL